MAFLPLQQLSAEGAFTPTLKWLFWHLIHILNRIVSEVGKT